MTFHSCCVKPDSQCDEGDAGITPAIYVNVQLMYRLYTQVIFIIPLGTTLEIMNMILMHIWYTLMDLSTIEFVLDIIPNRNTPKYYY